MYEVNGGDKDRFEMCALLGDPALHDKTFIQLAMNGGQRFDGLSQTTTKGSDSRKSGIPEGSIWSGKKVSWLRVHCQQSPVHIPIRAEVILKVNHGKYPHREMIVYERIDKILPSHCHYLKLAPDWLAEVHLPRLCRNPPINNE